MFGTQSSVGLLSEPQRAALVEAVRKLIRYYRAGEPESFMDFRVPPEMAERLVWSPKKFAEIQKWVVASEKGQPTYNDSRSNLEILSRYLTVIQTAEAMNSGSLFFCVGCWQGIDFKDAKLSIAVHTNVPDSLISTVMAADNLGGHFPTPIVTYDPSPADLVTRDQQVMTATIEYFVKTNGEITAYPVYSRWYWYPNKQLWLPLELHVAINTGSVNYIF
jgi:hypothetical protein